VKSAALNQFYHAFTAESELCSVCYHAKKKYQWIIDRYV